MKIHVYTGGLVATNGYLLIPDGPGDAILIDAPENAWAGLSPILAREGRKLAELWITHGHWDHTQGGAEIVRQTGARVRAHPADRVLIETPDVMKALAGRELKLEPLKVDFWLEQGQMLDSPVGSAEVRHVPGHCPGNVLFYFAGSAAAFVGDALFAGSVGRTDLPGGSFERLAQSIRTQIYTLPETTAILAGHGPQTTVAREKATNPYVHGA